MKIKHDYEWHWIEDGEYPELKDHVKEDGYNYRYSDLVLIYGKSHFVPDHRGQKDFHMDYTLGRYLYSRFEGFWATQNSGMVVVAWKYIDIKRPRKRRKNGASSGKNND